MVGLPSHLLNRLQSMLNAAAHLVCHTRKYDYITHLLWPALGPGKNTVSTCSACFQLSYLKDISIWLMKRHRLQSGFCTRLIVPRTLLRTIGDRSFCVTVTRAWNSLPTNVTASTSPPSFKRQLKTFLFTKSLPLVEIAFSNLCTVS